MSVDVKVKLDGYVSPKEIEEFLNDIGVVDSAKTSKRNYGKTTEKYWKEQFTKFDNNNNDQIIESGCFVLKYKTELRSIYYYYNNVNCWEDLNYYSKQLQERYVKGEHTELILGYYGKAVEIMKLICEHFGGWIDENDCDDEPPYYIAKKVEGKYAYSFNDEYYTGTFDTVEEALEEAKEINACVHYPQVWIGKCFTPRLDSYVDEDRIIESMYDALEREVGESADSFEVGIPEREELSKRLTACVEKWIKDFNIQPNCYGVEDVSCYELEDGDE